MMIDNTYLDSILDPPCLNVALTSVEHSLALDVEAPGSFMTYDPLATAALRGYFDGLVTGPTGLFDRKPFFTEARTVTTLAEFVGWLILHHDTDTKLLYMAQKFDHPEIYDMDKPPLNFNVRFAIIKN